MENYVTGGHIDFPLTLPKDGNNQTFPEGMLKIRNINAEQHTPDSLDWNQHRESLHCFSAGYFRTVFAAHDIDAGILLTFCRT